MVSQKSGWMKLLEIKRGKMSVLKITLQSKLWQWIKLRLLTTAGKGGAGIKIFTQKLAFSSSQLLQYMKSVWVNHVITWVRWGCKIIILWRSENLRPNKQEQDSGDLLHEPVLYWRVTAETETYSLSFSF